MTMVELLKISAAIYLVGAVVVTIIYAVLCFYLTFIFGFDDKKHGSKGTGVYLQAFLHGIAPTYILFWPWRVVGFPILIAVKIRIKTGRWRPWPDDPEALKCA